AEPPCGHSSARVTVTRNHGSSKQRPKTCQLGGKLSFPPPSEAGAFSASTTRQGRNQRGWNRGETGSWICIDGSGKTAAHREQRRQGRARERPSSRVDSRRGEGGRTQRWFSEPPP